VTYLVTGGTGFIGRHLLGQLSRRQEPILALVREGSVGKLKRLQPPGVKPLVGDVTKPALGLRKADLARLEGAVIFHLAAIYDLTASEADNRRANVAGTRHVVELANRVGAGCLNHVSSIAVAGRDFRGGFNEEMFDQGQALDEPYYRSKFEAERIVREECAGPFRIYRPGIVIGSSVDGAADRVDGPYYAFKVLQRLRDALPAWVPLLGLEGGQLNLVPVDFVAAALAHIAAQPGLDGRTFHLVDPKALSFGDTVNEFCRAAHAPQFTLRLDRRALGMVPEGVSGMLSAWPVMQALRRQLLENVKIPPAALAYVNNRARFGCEQAQAALAGSGIACPPLHSYAWKIWDYWERQLDPEMLTPNNLEAVLQGKVVVVTGASSGIGRALAGHLARHGARVMLVSRSRDKLEALRLEIAAAGGQAWVYPTDLADMSACQRFAEQVLQDHRAVDILINNAGRSIRRSIAQQTDRFHDFERTMQLNYFGAVKLVLAFLPGMRQRGSGHIINVSSIGVQSYPPRFGAYVASKSALAALARCLGPEVADDGVAVTNVHMPLVRTPMIAPTDIYANFPTIDTDQAAEMVLQAVLSRPPEVSTRLGKLGEGVDTVAPGLLKLVMTGAYHAFPESSGGSEARAGKEEGETEMSTEAAALAYLMRGVHF